MYFRTIAALAVAVTKVMAASSDSTITEAPTSSETTTNPWATYPTVAKTASINGFADPIYSDLPVCAQECVDQDTGTTPCPYWDTGCLCVWTSFANMIADCVADSCQGDDVSEMTILAQSICSSAGLPSPNWFIGAAQSTALAEAAAISASSTAESSAMFTSSSEESLITSSSEEPASSAESSTEESSSVESSSVEASSVESSSVAASSVESSSDSSITEPPTSSESTTNPWATYPTVAKTASINGFADPIYSDLPVCAQECVDQDTGTTPCPYWDTGCLCVWTSFANMIADCVADSCRGDDVSEMTILAQSICSSAGLPSPNWFIGAAQSTALAEAAAATVTVSSVESISTESSSSSETSSDSSSALITDAPSSSESTTNPYATYPTVAKTASINGFADPIYSELPECAKDCVDQDTGITPCPYWDTGCLCVMSPFANLIANCVAESCQGQDVSDMTSLATSICSSAGVPDPFWFIGAAQSTALAEAAAVSTTVSSVSATSTESSSEESTFTSSSAVVTSSADSSVIVSSVESSSVASSVASDASSVESSVVSSAASSVASSAASSVYANSTVTETSTDVETECPVCTNYPTTYTTVTDKVTVTASCEVYVTTDEEGSITTYSSDYPVTKTKQSTTVITITSCEDNKCTKVPVTTGLTTVSDETTTYTTYCPIEETTESTEVTVVTVTTCADGKCEKVPVTGEVSTYSDETTTYTTIVPVTETKGSSSVAPQTIASVSTSEGDASVSTYEGVASMKAASIFISLISFIGILI